MKRLQITFILSFLLSSLSLIGQEQEPEQILREAQNLIDEQAYEASLNLLETFIATFPNRTYDIASAYLMMSNNFLQLEQFEGAIWANQQSWDVRTDIRAHETLIENCLQFGQIYLGQNNHDMALDYLYQGLDMEFVDPEVFADINFNIARLLHQQGKFFDAEDFYYRTSQILEIEFGNDYNKLIPIYLQRTRIALAQNNFHEAMRLLESARLLMKINRTNWRPWQYLVAQTIAELSLGKYPSQASAALLQTVLVDCLKLLKS